MYRLENSWQNTTKFRYIFPITNLKTVSFEIPTTKCKTFYCTCLPFLWSFFLALWFASVYGSPFGFIRNIGHKSSIDVAIDRDIWKDKHEVGMHLNIRNVKDRNLKDTKIVLDFCLFTIRQNRSFKYKEIQFNIKPLVWRKMANGFPNVTFY